MLAWTSGDSRNWLDSGYILEGSCLIDLLMDSMCVRDVRVREASSTAFKFLTRLLV